MAENLELYNSAYTGAQIDSAVGAVLDNKDAWSGKQDALTGTQGQMVGFDANGKPVAQNVPKPRGLYVSLTVAGWDSDTKQQTVAVAGVLADGSKQMVSPYPADDASYLAWGKANIRCFSYAANSLTFSCDEIPAADINLLVKLEAAEVTI